MDDTVTNYLIPTVTGGITSTTAGRRLFFHATKHGWIFEDMSVIDYENSTNITMLLQDAIISQKREYDIDVKS